VVDDLLFKDEAALPKGLAGSPAFQAAFLAGARRAPDGGSLKDLQLDVICSRTAVATSSIQKVSQLYLKR
jgi:hypothetical protein